MRHPKKVTLAILALLLSVNAGLALPAPPDTVVAVPYTPAEAEGDQGGFILLTFGMRWRERTDTGFTGR